MEVELTWMELSVEMDGGRTVVVQGERLISEAWRSGQKTLDM